MNILSRLLNDESTKHYSLSLAMIWRVAGVAIVSGIMTWLLAFAFDRFMIDPVFCVNDANVPLCVNSAVISMNISLVLVGIMTVPLLVAIGVKRPLLQVASVVAALWSVFAWTGGDWLLSIAWVVAAFLSLYLAMLWINRIRSNAAAIIFMILFVAVARFIVLAP